jgi:hypothetical protein
VRRSTPHLIHHCGAGHALHTEIFHDELIQYLVYNSIVDKERQKKIANSKIPNGTS